MSLTSKQKDEWVADFTFSINQVEELIEALQQSEPESLLLKHLQDSLDAAEFYQQLEGA